jgi:hypothetical protein
MERESDYQKRGSWMLAIGILVGAIVLFQMVSASAPGLETLGGERRPEPGRAPSSFPASK